MFFRLVSFVFLLMFDFFFFKLRTPIHSHQVLFIHFLNHTNTHTHTCAPPFQLYPSHLHAHFGSHFIGAGAFECPRGGGVGSRLMKIVFSTRDMPEACDTNNERASTTLTITIESKFRGGQIPRTDRMSKYKRIDEMALIDFGSLLSRCCAAVVNIYQEGFLLLLGKYYSLGVREFGGSRRVVHFDAGTQLIGMYNIECEVYVCKCFGCKANIKQIGLD